MQPIIFDRIHQNKRIVVRSWSNRLTIINSKNHKIMREIDFKGHDEAMFFAKKLAAIK